MGIKGLENATAGRETVDFRDPISRNGAAEIPLAEGFCRRVAFQQPARTHVEQADSRTRAWEVLTTNWEGVSDEQGRTLNA
jgi:hypothetical protein